MPFSNRCVLYGHRFLVRWQTIDHQMQRFLRRYISCLSKSTNDSPNGAVKRGRLTWTSSRRQRATEKQLAETHGVLARRRTNAHGVLSNTLMEKACSWRDDGVSIKALQRNYGRSVLLRSPGQLLELLQRKAERAGGVRMSQDARQLKTSRTIMPPIASRRSP